ncbi:hypothetical protein [Corallococcus macrosporus]|uniref:Uncharacterized protein n=1 Tax=Corallococcus macrosporus DSM 14697 TaxID=1189310 RepID=A0A250K179_9BACT|nr:hypothetical protein [Corallococcus macrosporus]ATB49472.1 hypothetical protein MYMAC_005117 [Corallococcus macrosporus DSM 14697]
MSALQDLYRVYDYLRAPTQKMPLATLLRRQLVTPLAPAAQEGLTATRAGSPASGAPQDKLSVPRVRAAGVADLMIVKQQIKRYESAEIAHVENIVSGEKKSRSHRRLDKTEDTYTTESEVVHEETHELTTDDRFELQRETASTLSQQMQYGVDMSVSVKYGTMVEFSNQFEMEEKFAQEQSQKNASKFAHGIVERSLDKITKKTHEQRIRKLTQETEETNLHELNNQTGAHVRGIYQFLDKVYEAQVFNYGLREMFDFVIPEPASYVWSLLEGEPASELPPAPEKFNAVIDEHSYSKWTQLYGVTDVPPPPVQYVMLAADGYHGEAEGSESKTPRSVIHLEVQVPAGYVPQMLTVGAMALTNVPHPILGVTVAGQALTWIGNGSKAETLDGGSNHYVKWTSPPMKLSGFLEDGGSLPESGKVGIDVLAYESNTYAVSARLQCVCSNELLKSWKQEASARIQKGYLERLQEWEQKVEKLKAEARAAEPKQPFGPSPGENKRTLLRELKKHCISIITKQFYTAFNATSDGAPPTFNLQEAETEGSFIRFFEQSFEWDQLQYVFYPYFWGRRAKWPERFEVENADPEYRDFLQAGAARVVVPVRPGFELAVTHFLETGKLWNGAGAPPQISSELYLSILDEIRARTDAPENEKKVGEPWDIRVPTPLVLLRDNAELPQWQLVDEEKWTWEPKP